MSLTVFIYTALGQNIQATATVSGSERMPTADDDGGSSQIFHAGDWIGQLYYAYQSDVCSDCNYLEITMPGNKSVFVPFGENLYKIENGNFLTQFTGTGTIAPLPAYDYTPGGQNGPDGHSYTPPGDGGGDEGGDDGGGDGNGGNGTGDGNGSGTGDGYDTGLSPYGIGPGILALIKDLAQFVGKNSLWIIIAVIAYEGLKDKHGKRN